MLQSSYETRINRSKTGYFLEEKQLATSGMQVILWLYEMDLDVFPPVIGRGVFSRKLRLTKLDANSQNHLHLGHTLRVDQDQNKKVAKVDIHFTQEDSKRYKLNSFYILKS